MKSEDQKEIKRISKFLPIFKETETGWCYGYKWKNDYRHLII